MSAMSVKVRSGKDEPSIPSCTTQDKTRYMYPYHSSTDHQCAVCVLALAPTSTMIGGISLLRTGQGWLPRTLASSDVSRVSSGFIVAVLLLAGTPVSSTSIPSPTPAEPTRTTPFFAHVASGRRSSQPDPSPEWPLAIRSSPSLSLSGSPIGSSSSAAGRCLPSALGAEAASPRDGSFISAAPGEAFGSLSGGSLCAALPELPFRLFFGGGTCGRSAEPRHPAV
mmetsp:Transcript_11736/g.28188  ORF Transcript_11736/g.28188 Transcript_11736/m.28188 type:complete len:224 (+) Transcript_11736:219-890(+)